MSIDTKLIEYLRKFLINNNLDGIIINSTNDFLVEYNILELNSRYYVTNFTGSTGDVLLTANKIYLFVDTRYHEQADLEVDSDFVTVVKIPLNKSYLSMLDELLPSFFKLGIVGAKISKNFYDNLLSKVSAKNGIIKLLDSDPVIDYKKNSITDIKYDVFQLDIEISGIVADDKFTKIKKYTGDNFYILVTSLEDIAYLTNCRSFNFPYNAVFPAKAIITQDYSYIYTDCIISANLGSFFIVKPLRDFENAVKKIANALVFIDKTSISIQDYNLLNKSNTIKQSYFSLLKIVKNDVEKEHLKSCFERSDTALKIIYEMINSDKLYSEYEYSQALKNSLYKNGALSLSFEPIVASGANSSIIHYTKPSKDKIVQNGDFLLVDFGAYYEGGLATDTTRTFIKGEPSQQQKIVYTVVLKAFLNAYYKKYSKKSTYFDIDKIARDTIEKNITPDYQFAHSTGHGVGICVHENPPRLSSNNSSKTKIIENTVFSIEPGLYKENWGGVRLENTVFASYEDDQIIMRSFSKFPFEIKLVDFSLFTDEERFFYMKWQADALCIM